MKSLSAQLRALRPRPPSRRLKQRLFGRAARPGRPDPLGVAVGPLAVTAACSVFLAAWVGRDFALGSARETADMPWRVGEPVRPEERAGHSVMNALPARLEWTNTGPALSSMPSLPQEVHHRLP